MAWYLSPAALEAIEAPRAVSKVTDILSGTRHLIYTGEAADRLNVLWWDAYQVDHTTPDIRVTAEAVLGAVHGHPETEFLAGDNWPAIAAEVTHARAAERIAA
jgi:hypothetical protein